MRPPPPALVLLQRWLQQIVTAPGDIAETIKAAAELTVDETIASGQIAPLEGLAIYADQHRWRMAEALAERYPLVAAEIGEVELTSLAGVYFAANPHRGTGPVGDQLADFLATYSQLANRELVAALARLDRAVSQVAAEPSTISLDPERLAAIPPTAWPETRLRLLPALRLLQLDYPVHDYLIATSAGEDQSPSRRRSWLLVYRARSSGAILRAPLNHPQFLLLERLRAGESLAEAIGAAAAAVTDSFDLSAALAAWFQRWTGEGLFAALVTPSGES